MISTNIPTDLLDGNLVSTKKVQDTGLITTKISKLKEVESTLIQANETAKNFLQKGISDRADYNEFRAHRLVLKNHRLDVTNDGKVIKQSIQNLKDLAMGAETDLIGITQGSEDKMYEIEKAWKIEDDRKKAEEKARLALQLKTRIDSLEALGAVTKGDTLLLEDVHITIRNVREASDEKFEIYLERFQEVHLIVQKLVGDRRKKAEEIDPTFNQPDTVLHAFDDKGFADYLELLEMKRKKVTEKQARKALEPIDIKKAKITPNKTGKDKVNFVNSIEDVEEVGENLESVNDLFFRWYSETMNLMKEDTSVYKQPERDLLDETKKEVLGILETNYDKLRKLANIKL